MGFLHHMEEVDGADLLFALAPQQLECSCFSHLCCSLEGAFRQKENTKKSEKWRNKKTRGWQKHLLCGGGERLGRPGRSPGGGSSLHFSNWLFLFGRAGRSLQNTPAVTSNRPIKESLVWTQLWRENSDCSFVCFFICLSFTMDRVQPSVVFVLLELEASTCRSVAEVSCTDSVLCVFLFLVFYLFNFNSH